MKLSELFGSTLRKAPADAEAVSYQWLARGGYIRATNHGDFVTLPLATRSLNKLKARLRHEIEVRGGQEVGAHADFTRLAAGDIQSYRDLPKIIYAFDEVAQKPAPRLGLLGSAHSPSLHLATLTASQETQSAYQSVIEKVFKEFFAKLDLEAIKTNSGGYVFLQSGGHHAYLRCPQCGYLETQEKAKRAKISLSAEEPRPLEKVETPDCKTIEDLTAFLNLPKEKTAKAVFMTAAINSEEKLVFVILRGDMALNETKLKIALQADALRPATGDEIRAVDAVPGYASPVGVKDVLVVVDDLIPDSANLVAGANEEGYHLRNVNLGRDYEAERVLDLVLAQEGDPCPKCNTKLAQIAGVELLHKMPVAQSDEARYTDEEGKGQPVLIEEWTLDLGRSFAVVAESHFDDYGLLLPPAVTPYDIHLVWLPGKKMNTRMDADDLYLNLTQTGFTVLYDDRDARAGEKFTDADLIGCPVRITVGERALEEECVEIKLRRKKEKELVPLDEIANYVLENLE